MEEEDAVALKILNQKRSLSTQCTEDQFEEVMSYFEDIADQKHKYAYVDNTPILSFEELQKDPLFKEKLNEPAQALAEDIYEHWSARRMKSGNRHILPELKVGTMFPISVHQLTRACSSRQVKTVMMEIHMSASGDAKSDKPERPGKETTRVSRNCRV